MAVVRLEQLYPLPSGQIEAIVKKYGKNCKFIWMQEEPENMGPWSYMALRTFKAAEVELVSRPASSSPAATVLQ